jgi:hypothetical protein
VEEVGLVDGETARVGDGEDELPARSLLPPL